MPIAGLSNREAVDPRFVEIGRLRKGGEKRKHGDKMISGEDLHYFRYVPNVRYQESAAVFERIYSKEPTELEVFFPFDRMERVFSSWREAYGQNRLCKLRCDGARWHDWIEGDRHYHSEAGRECDLPYRDTENKCPECPCQYSGRLQVILRPMWKAGQIGLVTVMTSSINDIAHLASKLVQWEPLTNKPFKLWRAPTRIGVPIKGKRAAKESNLLHLELEEDWMRETFFRAQAQAAAALLEAPEERLPFDEPPIEDADYDAEIIEGDSFLEEQPEPEPEPAPAPVEFVRAPQNLSHSNIVKLAVRDIQAYKNEGAVMNALLAVVGKDWKKSTEWSVSQAWAEIQTHAQAG